MKREEERERGEGEGRGERVSVYERDRHTLQCRYSVYTVEFRSCASSLPLVHAKHWAKVGRGLYMGIITLPTVECHVVYDLCSFSGYLMGKTKQN